MSSSSSVLCTHDEGPAGAEGSGRSPGYGLTFPKAARTPAGLRPRSQRGASGGLTGHHGYGQWSIVVVGGNWPFPATTPSGAGHGSEPPWSRRPCPGEQTLGGAVVAFLAQPTSPLHPALLPADPRLERALGSNQPPAAPHRQRGDRRLTAAWGWVGASDLESARRYPPLVHWLLSAGPLAHRRSHRRAHPWAGVPGRPGPSTRPCARRRRPLSRDRPARLSYRRAGALFRQASGGWTLHQLRPSALTHLAEQSVSLPLLMARSRHASLRSPQAPRPPGAESVAALTAATDPARRRR
jgi:hypothetical protein